jgi:hypothetical protein
MGDSYYGGPDRQAITMRASRHSERGDGRSTVIVMAWRSGVEFSLTPAVRHPVRVASSTLTSRPSSALIVAQAALAVNPSSTNARCLINPASKH